MQFLAILIVILSCLSTVASKSPQISSWNPAKSQLYHEKSLSKHKISDYRRISSLRGGRSATVSSSSSSSLSSSDSHHVSNIWHDQTQDLQQLYYGSAYAHRLSVEEVLESLQVSSYHGLTSMEVSRRLNIFGHNKLTEQSKPSLLHQILMQFDDRLVQILLVVAVLSAVLASFEANYEAYIEPVVIMMILMINGFVSIYQSSSASSSLDALKKMQAEKVIVLRDLQVQYDVDVSSLVIGDIIMLKIGDKVPADARIIEIKSSSLGVDEASLTGESSVVMKMIDPIDHDGDDDDQRGEDVITNKLNILFSGTIITAGSCVAVVIATGEKTEMGKIDAGVQAAQKHQPKTPLQVKLDEFGQQLALMVSIICVTVFAINIKNFNNIVFGSTLRGALHYMNVAVALGVAAIPEGLPAVITLCLSLGTSRMAKQNVIVRKLPSVETLGCTTVICTDKTGTLTTGQMTATTLITFHHDDQQHRIGIKVHEIEGVSYNPIGEVKDIDQLSSSSLVDDVIRISTLCNEAKIVYNHQDHKYDRIGEPTEAAFKVLAEKVGRRRYHDQYHHDQLTEQSAAEIATYISDQYDINYDRLAILEFNRERKSMGVLVKERPLSSSTQLSGSSISSSHHYHQVLVKGAAEMVVMRCNRIKLHDNSIIMITDEIRQEILDEIANTAAKPLRCLAMAYKDVSDFAASPLSSLCDVVDTSSASSNMLLKDSSSFATIENDMILVGLVGIKDPARYEVRPAIVSCRDAGIRVMMITGDSKETAISIARDVGIFDGSEDINQCAFTGQEFFNLPYDQQVMLLRSNNKVFCRTEPQDKQRLVSMLQQQLDEVVAMTGDGVNDAPALQQASIGIAMGITGTDAAKSASDMILSDDNFASIVNAIELGRNIFANMQTFCNFLISSNIGEIMLMSISSLFGFPEPLLPLHLLWINLVTDGPPATALGFNPADKRVMKNKPRSKHDSLLSRWMLIRYMITGCYVGFAALSCYYSWFSNHHISLKQLSSWTSCDDWNSIFAKSSSLSSSSPPIDCSIFSNAQLLLKPQSMALASLVVMEMMKALSAVSLDQSMIIVQPWQNPWLIIAVVVPTMLHMMVMYVPLLSKIFSIAPLSLDEWKVSL